MTEAVLVLPLFLVSLLAVVDIARYMHTKTQLQNAAEHALSVAAVIQGLDDEDGTLLLDYAELSGDPSVITQLPAGRTAGDLSGVQVGPRGSENFNTAIEAILKRIDADLGSQLGDGNLQFDNGSYYLTPISAESGVLHPARIRIPEPSEGQSLKDAMVEKPIEIVIEGRFRPIILSMFGGNIAVQGRASGYRETAQKPAMPVALDCAGKPLFSHTGADAQTSEAPEMRTCACLNEPNALLAEWKQYDSESGGCVCVSGLVNVSNLSSPTDASGRILVMTNEVCGCPDRHFSPTWRDESHTTADCNTCAPNVDTGVGSFLPDQCRSIVCGGASGNQGEPAPVPSGVDTISSPSQACSCDIDGFCGNGTPMVVAATEIGEDDTLSARCQCDCPAGLHYSPSPGQNNCVCPAHKELVNGACQCSPTLLVSECRALNSPADLPNCECLTACNTPKLISEDGTQCLCPDPSMEQPCTLAGGTWNSQTCSCECPTNIPAHSQYVAGGVCELVCDQGYSEVRTGPGVSGLLGCNCIDQAGSASPLHSAPWAFSTTTCSWGCGANAEINNGGACVCKVDYSLTAAGCVCSNAGLHSGALWTFDASTCTWGCAANAETKNGECVCKDTHTLTGGACVCKNASLAGACRNNGGTWDTSTCSCSCTALPPYATSRVSGTDVCAYNCQTGYYAYMYNSAICRCSPYAILSALVSSGQTNINKFVNHRYRQNLDCVIETCRGAMVRGSGGVGYQDNASYIGIGLADVQCAKNGTCENPLCTCPNPTEKAACKGTWQLPDCNCQCSTTPPIGARWLGGSPKPNANCEWECIGTYQKNAPGTACGCPSDQFACGGQCYSACGLNRYFDTTACSCRDCSGSRVASTVPNVCGGCDLSVLGCGTGVKTGQVGNADCTACVCDAANGYVAGTGMNAGCFNDADCARGDSFRCYYGSDGMLHKTKDG